MEFLILFSSILYFIVFLLFVLGQYLHQLYNNRNYLMFSNLAIVFFKESNYKEKFKYYKIEIFLFLLGIFYLFVQFPISYFVSLNNFILVNTLYYTLFEFFIVINIIFILYLIIFKDLTYYFEYLLIYLTIIFFVYFLFFSTDLFLMYLCFEGISLSSFILISINYSVVKITDIGLKYFILSSLFSLIFLFDLVLIYLNCGTLDVAIINFILSEINSNLFFSVSQIFLAFILMGVTMTFKLGLFPFHFWVVDIYKKLSLINLVYFTIYLKYIYIVLFYKLVYLLFFSFFEIFTYLNLVIALLSILMASIGAIRSFQIREIISYSSILNMGFVALTFSPLTIINFINGFSYLIFYSLLMLFFYYIFLKLKDFDYYSFEYLNDFNSLFSMSYFYTFLLSIVFFGLSGIPPFVGFFYKFGLILSCISSLSGIDFNMIFFMKVDLLSIPLQSNHYFLVVIILLINIISSFVYLRIITHLFFYKITSYKLIKLELLYIEYIIIFFFCFFIIFGFFVYREVFFYLFKIILLDELSGWTNLE